MLEKKYFDFIKQHNFTVDLSQLFLVRKLEIFTTYLNKHHSKLLSKLFNKVRRSSLEYRGMYIWGEVGRGKTFVMDMFFENLTTEHKLRQHFHKFMITIHKELEILRATTSRIDYVTQLAIQLAKRYKIIYLDELQINNIADAMLVGRLFAEMIKCGILIFLTSNREPQELYRDGLQRESFLPFISIIEKCLQILHLNNYQDYRFEKLKLLQNAFVYPLNKKNNDYIQLVLKELSGGKRSEECIIVIDADRDIRVLHSYGQMAIFTFNELCVMPLGAQDYIALCKQYNTLIITNIPKMNDNDNNEALRFITLIDCMYDMRTKIICSAECPLYELYDNGKHTFEFRRTISRLTEMQSVDYLN